MPHPKGDKHHYIPKFYLKRWAAADGRITEYSRPFNRVEPRWTHPDGTGYERGLYAIPGMPPDQINVIEQKVLKNADNLASLTMDCLIGGLQMPKPTEMRSDWSRFVFSLMLRFPEAQRTMRRDLEASVRKEVLTADDPDAEMAKITATNDLDRATAGVFVDLLNKSKVTTATLQMIWEVITLMHPKNTFLTSDRPVIVTGRLFDLNDDHLAIPISPIHLFVASNSERVFATLRGRADDRLVTAVNDEVVRNATRYVWGCDNSQLRFIENRLTKSVEPALPFKQHTVV